MLFRQYELSCLSLFSYLVADEGTGRGVVIDPQRDVSGYLADAAALGVRIERVIETHVHADFLSGHRELAAATGAVISYGDRAKVGFAMEPLAHGQRLELGSVVLEIRHTPGHTPEGISIVVHERADAPPALVLTGDTLFIGDVGRPDLLAAAGTNAEELATDLHRSLHEQLLTLPDATLVYPAHGAGSACGKHLSTATRSTIGEQRADNYALAPMPLEAFVRAVTSGQPAAPPYFAHAVAANRSGGTALFDEGARLPELSLADALDASARGAVLLDTRDAERFARGHLRGSLNVGIDGRFAEYAGDVIAAGTPIVVLGDSDRVDEARVRLARIGFDSAIGAVPAVEARLLDRPDMAAHAARVTAADLAVWVSSPGAEVQLVDVRSTGETDLGTLAGARTIPLAQLVARIPELDATRPTVVYCAGGYRSSIAASVLRTHGFGEVADLLGGYPAAVAAAATTATVAAAMAAATAD